MSLKIIKVFASFTLLASTTCLCLAADADERNTQRETLKLQAIPKEQLSAQSLVDIYSACIRLTLAQEDMQAVKSFTAEGLQKHCQDERRNLADNISQKGVDNLDALLVTRLNDALEQQ